MLSLQFFGQNLHFAVNLFAALVFFAVFWLYFDAWINKKNSKELFKWAGALLLFVSFLLHATAIEQSVLGRSIFGDTTQALTVIFRFLGYAGLIIGQILDPLQKVPKSKGITNEEFNDEPKPKAAKVKAAPAALAVGKVFGLIFALPVGALTIALLYYRRASKGLERHLRPVATAFLLLAISELIALGGLFRGTNNPQIYNLVKAFGPLWIAELLFLLASALVLGHWVWNYLIKRFLSQLFMIFILITLTVFLLTTVSFTYLLTRSVQNNSLDNLETASNVLSYALDSKRAETRANAEAVAQSSQVVSAVQSKDHKSLSAQAKSFLADKKESSLIITTSSAQVLLRAEDPERWSDSISSDPLVRKALVGETASTIVTTQGVLAPILSIKSAVPVRDASNLIIGTVTTSVVIDNGLVDGIKSATGLDSAVYSDNALSATTLTAPDGKTRQLGVKQTNQAITSTVLKNGKVFKGSLGILNRQYLAVYTPLKDVNNTVVGMLFIGQPQSAVLKTAGHSIELTFLLAAGLLLLSIVPAYFTSKYLSYQLD
ncbi:MAG: hypothetical protein JWO47_916 [Candidatus Saccharibacteria bacterium]|nr:hypothetical protein [Candidatus Saccharibacteria bacterium]